MRKFLEKYLKNTKGGLGSAKAHISAITELNKGQRRYELTTHEVVDLEPQNKYKKQLKKAQAEKQKKRKKHININAPDDFF